VALPITVLPVAMALSSSFALLVPAVGCAPLPAPGGITAGGAAVPRSSIATRANGERSPTLWRTTDSQLKNGARLADRASHSDIMPEAARLNRHTGPPAHGRGKGLATPLVSAGVPKNYVS